MDEPQEANCNNCKKKGSYRCVKCKVAYYCSKDCQKENWNSHTFVCDTLNETRKAIFQRFDEFVSKKGKSLVFKKYYIYLNKISQFSVEEIIFFSNLFIAITRVLEITTIDIDTKKSYFPEWNKKDLKEIDLIIVQDFTLLRDCVEMKIQKEFQLTLIKKNQDIVQAKENIIKNFDIVKIIEPSINFEGLKVFLEEQTFYEFTPIISLCGLSSTNGKNVYFRSGEDSKTIEHELMHNITRYFLKTRNYRYLSPMKNQNLKINGEQVEAGDFYEYSVYKIIPKTISPFCLTGYFPRKLF